MIVGKKLIVKKSTAGLGLFANEEISKGDFLIEYIGKKITHEVADEIAGRYLFTLNSRYVIDGKGRKNTARYINHSCNPNCEPVIDNGKIVINAVRKINFGDELTYDYGRDYFEAFIGSDCMCQLCRKQI